MDNREEGQGLALTPEGLGVLFNDLRKVQAAIGYVAEHPEMNPIERDALLSGQQCVLSAVGVQLAGWARQLAEQAGGGHVQ